jgi:S-adenosylmethionine/arginine decarboxylase-like enzyme
MKTGSAAVASGRGVLSAWMITLVATAAGVLLVATGLLGGLAHPFVLAFLAGTCVLWGVSLRANLGANWLLLLRRDGASTNVLAQAAFELAGRRGPRAQRVTAGAGYVATEPATEAPYYAGALGAAIVTVTTPVAHAVIANEVGLDRAMQRAPEPASRTIAPWGMLAAIDLHGCEHRRLEDPDIIRRFVASVIEAIGMRAHGPLRLERFGDGELEGYSAMQFIETSSITIHADEVSGRCFVDVFSCREFDPEIAAAVAVAHFGGTPTLRMLER